MYFYTVMEYEFDAAKSESNKLKHGLDFFEAQKLWQDADAIAIPARAGNEPRSLLIARLEKKLWTVVYTEREGRIRIISVRRSRTSEEAIYEQTENDSTEP